MRIDPGNSDDKVEVLDFPDEAALHYAQIRAALKASGAMIGANYYPLLNTKREDAVIRNRSRR